MQCFQCEENCGLFVGLDKLSRDPQGSSRAKGSSSSQNVTDETSVRKSSGSNVNASPKGFKIGDRVVVYNKKNIPVHGVVVWVGKYSGPGVNFTMLGIETVSV